MSDSDLIKLYSARILGLAADIPHLGRLSAPQGTARIRSPLCGSTVTADVVVQDGRKRMPEGTQNYKYLPWSAIADALGLD